jgi:ribosomal protein S25
MVEYPNGHGSGHAGNATSKERQQAEDAKGLTESRQAKALQAVTAFGANGLVVAELELMLGVGHGQASSALSHLHRAGKVVRLKSRRNKQEIYVVPDFVKGREESPYNPRLNRKHPKFYNDATVLKAMKEAGMNPLSYEADYQKIRKFLEALP